MNLVGLLDNGPFSKYIHNKICIFMTIDKILKVIVQNSSACREAVLHYYRTCSGVAGVVFLYTGAGRPNGV